MTSNIGARHLQKRTGLGFQSEQDETISDKVEDMVKNEVKKTFNPEFLNRLDEVIIFKALTEVDLIQIVELMVQQLNQNLAQRSITVTVTEDARKWILDKTVVDRTLRRASAAPRTAEVHRRPAVGGAHPGHLQDAAGLHRGLPRQQPALLSPGRRGRSRRRAAVLALSSVPYHGSGGAETLPLFCRSTPRYSNMRECLYGVQESLAC